MEGVFKSLNPNDSEENDDIELNDHLPYRIGNYLWIYGSPVLILVGTVGNILSIIVLLRPRLRDTTTMFYLTCLSIGDLFTLYTGLLRYWIYRTFDIDVRNLSNASCKIHTFLVYLSLDFTVWVLVCVTVDRFLSVSMPFRAKRLCTMTRSRIVIAGILLLLSLKNMHFLWTLTLVETWEYRCDGDSSEDVHFLRFIWPWLDLAVFCLVPFSVMIVCNIKIIYEMVLSQKKLDAHRNYGSQRAKQGASTSRTSLAEPSVFSMQSVTPQHANVRIRTTSESKPNAATNARTGTKRVSSLTAMLLAVNTIFLLTTSPVQILLVGEEYWFSNRDDSNSQVAWYNFWWALVNMLQYLNNAIHFFLYCLTGPKFRHELFSIFNRKNKVAITKHLNEQTQTEI
ncbi:psychosine receptor-like [Mya arenaria]|uniref:psychosine receptor-like n=1 Tax=Mya arenaria TaxID=6604 RepID=UPI0022E0F3ED|nr:psychosine receptor-like [Mya arenaria]